jgi:hypothetical protein
MGNNISYKTVTFDDVMYASSNCESWIIITTLPESTTCFIYGTCPIDEEEKQINQIIDNNRKIKIIVYGSSSSDTSVIKKYNQLRNVGLKDVFIYMGGLFEWLLLQDVYSSDIFRTNGVELDILKYSGRPYITQNKHRIHASPIHP